MGLDTFKPVASIFDYVYLWSFSQDYLCLLSYSPSSVKITELIH